MRAKLDAAGVAPGQLKTLADIARFPFSVKADLRDNFPFGLFAVPREQVLRLHASSGTTGRPTVVGYTRADLDLWSDLIARSLACMGAKPGDIFHNALRLWAVHRRARVSTTAPSGSAAPRCRCRAAPPSGRSR